MQLYILSVRMNGIKKKPALTYSEDCVRFLFSVPY